MWKQYLSKNKESEAESESVVAWMSEGESGNERESEIQGVRVNAEVRRGKRNNSSRRVKICDLGVRT